jgi:hypothetical protein
MKNAALAMTVSTPSSGLLDSAARAGDHRLERAGIQFARVAAADHFGGLWGGFP